MISTCHFENMKNYDEFYFINILLIKKKKIDFFNFFKLIKYILKKYLFFKIYTFLLNKIYLFLFMEIVFTNKKF